MMAMGIERCFAALADTRADEIVVTSAGNSSEVWWELTRDLESTFYLEASMSLSTMFAAGLALSYPRTWFWAFLGVLLVFTLGNSTDALLILRANQLGVSTGLILLLWAVFHVVKSASSTPGGSLSDRFGRRPLIIAGWLVYSAVYLGFALATATWHAWAP